MATTTEDWIEELKGISVLELSERIKALEEAFGVSATAVAAAAPAAAGAGGDGAAEEEESSTVDVLHGQVVGVLGSPLTGLVRGLNQMIAGLAIALGQIQAEGKLGAEAEPPPPEDGPDAGEDAETPAEEAPAEEAPSEETQAETETEEAPSEGEEKEG